MPADIYCRRVEHRNHRRGFRHRQPGGRMDYWIHAVTNLQTVRIAEIFIPLISIVSSQWSFL